MEKQFIAISGNIGAGKSTLTTMLAGRLGVHWRPFYEAVDGNPYLADFYRDMQKWSFHLQVFFLGHRARTHLDICAGDFSAVQDRSIYEDASIFARALRDNDMLDERAYQAYRGVYDAMIRTLPPPDLIVYLEASVPTLLERIAKRGRDIAHPTRAGVSEMKAVAEGLKVTNPDAKDDLLGYYIATLAGAIRLMHGKTYAVADFGTLERDGRYVRYSATVWTESDGDVYTIPAASFWTTCAALTSTANTWTDRPRDLAKTAQASQDWIIKTEVGK